MADKKGKGLKNRYDLGKQIEKRRQKLRERIARKRGEKNLGKTIETRRRKD